MFKKFTICLVSLMLFSIGLMAQQNDPVLFSVNGSPVNLSEFQYIYSKTNGDKANFSRASLDEYLDLYIKFKLKVERAKDMQLDTIPALQKELAGYRQQLANSYLVDKEVTDRLVSEAYDRTKTEVEISHIMVALKPNASKKQEADALKKITSVYEMLKGGDNFERLAREYSEDDYSKKRKGRLGFFAAMFRKGFYEMETAAYSLKKGAYSKPVRTVAGYHIIKVTDIRDARGEIEVGHILLRTKKDKVTKALLPKETKMAIDGLYEELQKGANFEELAKLHSDDKSSKAKGGLIGPLTTNSPIDEIFKDAAFSIAKNGGYSKPIQTSVGWHIIKKVSTKKQEIETIAKRRLQTKIQEKGKKKNNVQEFSRQAIAKEAMMNRIQKEGGFKSDQNIYTSFASSLDSTFLTHKWKVPAKKDERVLFSFKDGMTFTVNDFANYSKRSSARMRQRKKADLKPTLDKIYKSYLEESCMKYEESQLEKKYPEFKSLMREYEEGILLFEATKMLVWDKASQDTVGLQAFHKTQPNKYLWDERAEVSIYSLKAGNEKTMEALRKVARKKGSKDVLKKINKKENILAVQTKTFEKGKNDKLAKTPWKGGSLTDVEVNPRNKSQGFTKIEKIIPSGTKSLKEARGYVIADYQDHLEKEWLKELRTNYKVDVNDKVFESMIKK